MGRYFSFPILLFAVIIQTTVVPEFRIAGGGPDFVLMIVLSWVLLAGPEEGVIWAIVGGVLYDLGVHTPTGMTALALVVTGAFANLIAGQISRTNVIYPPFIAAITTPIYHVTLVVLLTIAGRAPSLGYVLINVTLPTAIINFFLMLLVFRVMGRLYVRTRPRGISM